MTKLAEIIKIMAPSLYGQYPPHERPPTLYDIQKEYITQTLIMRGRNKSLAAKDLGIGRATLYRKLKEYGIK